MLEDPTFVCTFTSNMFLLSITSHPGECTLAALLPIDIPLLHDHTTSTYCSQLCAPHESKLPVNIWFHTVYSLLLRTASCAHSVLR